MLRRDKGLLAIDLADLETSQAWYVLVQNLRDQRERLLEGLAHSLLASQEDLLARARDQGRLSVIEEILDWPDKARQNLPKEKEAR